MVKFRLGFVSNSSTTTFLIIGFETEKSLTELQWTFDRERAAICHSNWNKTKHYIGMKVDGSDDWVEVEMTPEKFKEHYEWVDELRTKLKETNPIKIFAAEVDS